MPEESFEQQARRMAEPFSIEPQPVVWQRVEAAIAPKRRRRGAFVWWLLPLCVACGVSFWLMNSKKISLQNKTFAKPTATAKPNISEPNKNEKADEKSIQKSSEKKDAVSKPYKLQIPTAKANFFVENKKLKTNEKDEQNKNKADQTVPQSEFSADKNGVKQKDEQYKKYPTSIQPQTHLAIENNTVVDSSKAILQNDTKSKTDTVKTNATIIVKTNDSLKQNKDSAVAKLNKKQKQNKWRTGVVAEAGASWLGNGFFSVQKATDLTFASNQSGASSGNSVGSSAFQTTKKSTDAGLGIVAKTNLSKRWFFDAQLLYRYQQFSIQTITTISSPTALNGNIVRSNTSYRLQSANFYAGIGFSVVHPKNISVALQTGIDNGWLFLIKQKQNDSLTSHATQGFQRWQPLANVAIPISFYAHNITRWQVSPFVRWGLRSVQKNSASYQHRPLNSAGVQVIYFFK